MKQKCPALPTWNVNNFTLKTNYEKKSCIQIAQLNKIHFISPFLGIFIKWVLRDRTVNRPAVYQKAVKYYHVVTYGHLVDIL